MLIGKDSILNKIPPNLEQRQIFLLEGIRYCGNSIFISFLTLKKELEYVSNNSLRSQSCSIIFKEAWSQIDSTHRLTNLLSALYSYDPENEKASGDDFEYLLQVKPFRHTFQHLDERIDELLLELNAPVWGNISWANFLNKEQCKAFVLSAGHPRNNFESRIVNPAGQTIQGPIDLITIEAVQKDINEKIARINLSELYRRTEKVIKKIEEQTEEQISEYKKEGLVDGNLGQDLLVCVNMKFH